MHRASNRYTQSW